MKKHILTIRDVDEEAWRKFRARTAQEGMKTGDALSQAIITWVKEKEESEIEKKPNPKPLLKIRPVTVGRGKVVRWSEEIDETLYYGATKR